MKRFNITAIVSIFLFVSGLNSADLQTNTKAFKRALNHLKMENYSTALQILEKLVKENSKNALYWFNLGNAYYKLNKLALAIQSYKRVVSLKSPILPVAKLFIAKSLGKQRDYKNSLKILEELYNSNLPSSISDLVKDEFTVQLTDQGIFLYEEENYKKALRYFERALEVKPTKKAQMMKGLTLVRLDQSSQARHYFKKLGRSSPMSGIGRAAKNFLKIIDEGAPYKTKSKWLYLSSTGGYNNNIYGNGKSENPEKKFNTQFLVGGGYKYFTHGDFSAALTTSLSWIEVIDLPSNRFVTNAFSAPFQYDYGSCRLVLEPIVKMQYLDRYYYLVKSGYYLGFTKVFTEKIEAGVGYSYLKYTPWQEVYDYQKGWNKTIKIYAGYIGKIFYFGGYYLNWKEDLLPLEYETGSVPLAHKSNGFGSILNLKIASSWQMKLSGQYLKRTYTPEIVPDGRIRKDTQGMVSFNVTYLAANTLSFFIVADYIKNKSNLEEGDVVDKNYDQAIIGFGVLWEPI